MKLKIGSALLLGAVGLVLHAGKFVLKIKISQVKKKKRKVPAETGCASSEGKQLRIKVSHGAMGKKGAT